MTTLTATPYSVQPRRDSVCFYFGVEALRCHELPIGAAFGCVYSPSLFCESQAHWRYVRFRVVMYQALKGQPLERGYAVERERPLTASEAQYFESKWREATCGQKTLSRQLG